MVELDEIKAYCRIDDDTSQDALLMSLSKTAMSYLKSSISPNLDEDDERVKTLSLMVINDLYDNRGTTTQVSTNTRKLVSDLMLQMQLESR